MIAIVATDKKNGIGKNNQLLCYLPDDLKHFKKLTMNHVVIMGRKTFESIGKPLPHRVNIVLSSHPTLQIDGVEVYADYLLAIQDIKKKYPDKKIFIIGGAQIYKLFYPYIEEIHRTLIHHTFDADVFFPEFKDDFVLVESILHPTDEKHAYSFEFQTWRRKE